MGENETSEVRLSYLLYWHVTIPEILAMEVILLVMVTPNTIVLLALKSGLSISQECECLVRDNTFQLGGCDYHLQNVRGEMYLLPHDFLKNKLLVLGFLFFPSS